MAVAVPMAMMVASQVARLIGANKQRKEAEWIRNSNTIDNQQIPQEVKDMLAMHKSRANGGYMPGLVRAENNINRGVSNLIDKTMQTGPSSDIISNMAGYVNQGQMDSFSELGNIHAGYQDKARLDVADTLQTIGSLKQTSYDRAMSAAAALEGAARSNTDGAIQQIAGIGANYFTNNPIGNATGKTNMLENINQDLESPNKIGEFDFDFEKALTEGYNKQKGKYKFKFEY